jgi:YhcH/YjgK/YiaL family protein
MISDHCINWKAYSAIAPGVFQTAFDFIKAATPETEEKRYDLCGNDIYALVQKYTTKLLNDGRMEAHRRYVDIQAVISGTEIIGVSSIAGLKEISAYNDEKDFELFEHNAEISSLIKLCPGDFMLLRAGEGHMPCLAIGDKQTEVKKVVIKVRRELLIK